MLSRPDRVIVVAIYVDVDNGASCQALRQALTCLACDAPILSVRRRQPTRTGSGGRVRASLRRRLRVCNCSRSVRISVRTASNQQRLLVAYRADETDQWNCSTTTTRLLCNIARHPSLTLIDHAPNLSTSTITCTLATYFTPAAQTTSSFASFSSRGSIRRRRPALARQRLVRETDGQTDRRTNRHTRPPTINRCWWSALITKPPHADQPVSNLVRRSAKIDLA